ncbi:cardiotrophin-2-like [Pantherophis guttatus]|uniref:Cardiotrophin-2-like n=1 Tax=Pantherophis guttatus TaxID=94885 RepID=A0A6P9C788_PANGU|nr:cardiotrophin-2-like [Pantherophis guttatus]
MNPCLVTSLFLICASLLHVAFPERNGSVNTAIHQTFNLASHLKGNSSVLLETYLRHQGPPFTDKDFHTQGLNCDGLPVAAISFLEWRILNDLDRLDKNYKAYSIISEFLQLVWDDQFELNPTEDGLLNMLKDTRMQVQGLVNNLTIIISALRAPPSPVSDPLTLDVVKTNTFEKKVRGYVVCSTYKQWIDRTVRDFNLLVKKYPL